MTQIKLNNRIEALAAYQLADLNVPDDKTLISLAQNELCFSPSKTVKAAIKQSASHTQFYPDADWTVLKDSLAALHQLNPQQILCGAGSMELLEVLGRIYLSTCDRVLMSEFGYSFFKTVAKMYGAAIDTARESNYFVDVDSLLEHVKPDTKIVFVANPGNPTGTFISSSEIRRLREALPDKVLLIIDEAYAEFTDTETYTPLFDLVDQGNTVVLRTFSKIYGLAAMRIGWGYFPPSTHAAMRKVLNPNNVTAASQAAATAAVTQQHVIKKRAIEIRSIRENFTRQLQQLGLHLPLSQSNFVLVKFPNAALAQTSYTLLREQGILMRPMGVYGLDQCLRATLSHPTHMDLTLKHLSQILKENTP